MKKKTFLITIALIALLSIGFVYGIFTDWGSANVSVTAATLKVCEIKIIPETLGNNIVPGNSGIFLVNFKNCGTIEADYEVKLSEIPDFLQMDNLQINGRIGPAETKEVKFSWTIPLETDLGEGGQLINIKAEVYLSQITP